MNFSPKCRTKKLGKITPFLLIFDLGRGQFLAPNQVESRILLKPMLGGVRIVALSFSFMNRLNKMESAVFLYCRFFLFLKVPFILII